MGKKFLKIFLIIFFLFIGPLACSQEGGFTGLEATFDDFGSSATGEEEDTTKTDDPSYASPTDDGFDILPPIAKLDFPSVNGSLVTGWMGPPSDETATENEDYGQSLWSFLSFGRKAYASSDRDYCHVEGAPGAVNNIPVGYDVVVTIEKSDGSKKKVTAESDGRFYTFFECDAYDPLKIYLENSDDPSNTGPEIFLTLLGGGTILMLPSPKASSIIGESLQPTFWTRSDLKQKRTN